MRVAGILLKSKIILIIFFITFSYSKEKVTLQLKWFHQFQFAGYYVAKEKGYYDDVDLDVEIKQRDLKYNNIQQVINNEAQYGVADSALLLNKIKDEPVVIVAAIFQHSPNVLITLKSSDINSPYDLDNKDILTYANNTDSFAIYAMFKKLGIKPNFIEKKDPYDYMKLINHEVSVTPAYLSNEPFYLKEKNIPINIINPRNYGFDLYGDMLFTNENEAINHPRRVEKFKEATLKGWEYALKHKEEVVQLIYNKYNNNKSIEHLRFEANSIEDMIDEKSIPLGTIDKGRLKYISDLYKDYGLFNNGFDIKDFIFEEFKNNLNLTKEELVYIKNKKEITYCIDPNWMPFEEILDSKHTGITLDYFKIFEKKIGIPLKLVPTSSWPESLFYVENRKCDIISLLAETPKRKEFLDFTNSYIQSPLVIVTRNDELFISEIPDISNLKNKQIGIVKDYAYIDILKKKYPNINIYEVKNVEDGLNKVKNKELYGFIDTLTTVSYVIQNKFISQLKISGKIDENWNLGIGTRNDEPLLHNIFNKAINTLTFEDKQLIFNKWIPINIGNFTDYKVIALWVLGTIFIFGIILYVFISANMKLNKEIKKREEIEKRLLSFNKLIDDHIISSSTDLKGYITDVSNAFCKISKYSREELIGKNQNIVRHPDMKSEVYKDLWKTIGENKIWDGELKDKAKDGSAYWIYTTISPKYDEFNNKIGYISIKQDITDKKIIEEISIKDGLTNIYNQRYFSDFSLKFLNSSKRNKQHISFVILDIDYFKQYNDTYGHQEGDNALRKVANTLKEFSLRSDDYCFRLGGEEFGILFKSENKDRALHFVFMILKSIEKLEIEHKNSKVSQYITVSMGLYSDYANNIIDVDDMYRKADKLLYSAKESGRNRVVSN
ncbi:BvgS-like domain-containing diguanylate cyclase (NMT1, PAS domains) [Arcobacter venerupis]|uniref:Thiamine pyrimidine synthase n=1 Tax=Arcobacter venerupis TaxID=1054033 RepID=A0AAE7E4F0_9BACT|nr:ABC transporter substrate-binding protein [Arcobacter venerupis]QKF67329.1 BvgS-like domain-containing diguanylate cyclase (NMT1, PAS domains) [Arcobacter venerupis]RWS50654.1 diguanylate cyclase [Arcobacter venerupis]